MSQDESLAWARIFHKHGFAMCIESLRMTTKVVVTLHEAVDYICWSTWSYSEVDQGWPFNLHQDGMHVVNSSVLK